LSLALCRATGDDAAALADLDARVSPAPWSEAQFAGSLAHDQVLVLRGPGGLSGHLLLRVAGDEAEVLLLGVDPARRRRGLGRLLLEAGLRLAASRGAARVFLEVRPSNRAALALYRAAGFEEVGRRRDYYRSPPEDALVLARPGPAGAYGRPPGPATAGGSDVVV